VRKVLDSSTGDLFLEACRFYAFHVECERSSILPEPGSIFYFGRILVRQTREGASRVFVDAFGLRWCAMEWQDKGCCENGWSRGNSDSGCVEEGPEEFAPVDSRELQFLSTEHLWIVHMSLTSYDFWLECFGKNAVSKTLMRLGAEFSLPLLMETNDMLIMSDLNSPSIEERELRKFSASGQWLHSRKLWAYGNAIGLMEGGSLVFPGQGTHISCINSSDFSDCWPGVNLAGSNHGQLLGVLPLSPTRSLAVFSEKLPGTEWPMRISGILMDAPGLKKDAPWPIWGHDVCRTFNASVPIDNCWDGPK